jgi:hypothetical protein
MADVYSDTYQAGNMFAAEKGNAWTEDLAFAKSGVVNTDKLYFGIVPAGVRVTGVKLVAAAAGASTTLSIGYEPVDGTTPVAALTAFFNAQAISAAGAFNSAAAPITFEKPVKLVGTVGGANFTGAPALAVVMTGEMVGAK